MVRRLKNSAHFLIAFLALVLLNNPAKKLKVIGITGTDGKTTTASFVYQLLTLAGKKAALISTVGVFMGEKRESLGFHVTTPSPFTLNKYLKKALELNIEYVVVEVSSHAIDQNRILGISFDAGTITNVTSEHLDYHKNIESYLNTKMKLLKVSKKVVLDSADPFLETIKEVIKDKSIYTYSADGNSADLNYNNVKSSHTQNLTFYNKKNLLTALLLLKVLGFNVNDLKNHISKLKLPEGRLEYLKKEPYCVIVDFAHTPNAFKLLLPELKQKTRGKLIHVFGSAGKRDKSKRPEMGKESSTVSDIIILTAEDPRNEKVSEINTDIKKGVSDDFTETSSVDYSEGDDRKKIIEIYDRKEAIKFALSIAQRGDCVIITGKGPEKSMNIGGREIPWDDIEITRSLLK